MADRDAGGTVGAPEAAAGTPAAAERVAAHVAEHVAEHEAEPPPGHTTAPVRPPVVDTRPTVDKLMWRMPFPYGTSAAVDSMTGVAAPLLAGFCITLLGVVAQAPGSFRWPGAALIALVVAAGLMVTCVQIGFRAQAFIYSRADFEQWRPQPVESQDVEEYLKETQQQHYDEWQSRQRIARIAYNGAIVALAAALAVVAAPPQSGATLTVGTTEQVIRWIAAGLAAAGGLGELFWVAKDQLANRAGSRNTRRTR